MVARFTRPLGRRQSIVEGRPSAPTPTRGPDNRCMVLTADLFTNPDGGAERRAISDLFLELEDHRIRGLEAFARMLRQQEQRPTSRLDDVVILEELAPHDRLRLERRPLVRLALLDDRRPRQVGYGQRVRLHRGVDHQGLRLQPPWGDRRSGRRCCGHRRSRCAQRWRDHRSDERRSHADGDHRCEVRRRRRRRDHRLPRVLRASRCNRRGARSSWTPR